MKQTITLPMFINAFKEANRLDNFSLAGLEALFNTLEDIDPNYELDIIHLCCEYTEYKGLKQVIKAYPTISDISELYDNAHVIEFKNGLIVSEF